MSGKSKTWFGFSYFLLPAVLKVLYVIGTIVMLAGGVYVIVDLWSSTNLETRILYIVMAALSPFFVRFVFELLLLPFRIAEDDSNSKTYACTYACTSSRFSFSGSSTAPSAGSGGSDTSDPTNANAKAG
jgi:hypothetical protein